MRDAVKKALESPFFLSFPVAILGLLVVIMAILVLLYRATKTEEVSARVDQVIRNQEVIRKHIDANARAVEYLESEDMPK